MVVVVAVAAAAVAAAAVGVVVWLWPSRLPSSSSSSPSSSSASSSSWLLPPRSSRCRSHLQFAPRSRADYATLRALNLESSTASKSPSPTILIFHSTESPTESRAPRPQDVNAQMISRPPSSYFPSTSSSHCFPPFAGQVPKERRQGSPHISPCYSSYPKLL